MPIYEYRCESCGHELEAIQKMSDDPLKECPSCGKPALTKLISAAGFRLKGSGWYVTDFRDKKKKSGKETTESKADTSGKPDAGKGESSKSDSGTKKAAAE